MQLAVFSTWLLPASAELGNWLDFGVSTVPSLLPDQSAFTAGLRSERIPQELGAASAQVSNFPFGLEIDFRNYLEKVNVGRGL